MSAWIAPFHYTQLPAHYQSHNCFNNRSPPLPVLLFPWQPTMRRARKRERRRKIAEAGKKKTWMRGWECRPLTPGSICKEGNLHYKCLSFSKVKLANEESTSSSSTAHHARSLSGKDVNFILFGALQKNHFVFQENKGKRENERGRKENSNKTKPYWHLSEAVLQLNAIVSVLTCSVTTLTFWCLAGIIVWHANMLTEYSWSCRYCHWFCMQFQILNKLKFWPDDGGRWKCHPEGDMNVCNNPPSTRRHISLKTTNVNMMMALGKFSEWMSVSNFAQIPQVDVEIVPWIIAHFWPAGGARLN